MTFDILIFLFILQSIIVKCNNVTVGRQLAMFKEETNGPIGILTVSVGAPVYSNEISSINQNLLTNEFFMDSFGHFDRERIPARVVHAKGDGASGYFEVTQDVTHICKAKLFNGIGKRTPVFVRFSPALNDPGSSDTTRDNVGMAVKFYTEDGNLDLLGLSAEMFLIKDPIKFIPYIHALRRNPVTNLKDETSRWDFITQNPETMFMFLRLYGDRGIPDGHRFLPGFVVHAFQVYNELGETSFVKFSFDPVPFPKNLTSDEAADIQRQDLDYAARDLYNAILNEDYPTWKLAIQVLSADEVRNADFDVFDVTKVWPKYVQKIEIGTIVLDQLPTNFFAEVEQVAMNPANLVPGILGGVDSLFIARRFSYRDAQFHRIGGNFNKISVNCPEVQRFSYNRDSQPPVNYNGNDAPNYYPNSFNGPEVGDINKPALWTPYVDPTPNNFEQAGNLYINEMSEGERSRVVENIVQSLKQVEKFLQIRAIELFNRIHSDLAQRVEQQLSENCEE